MKDLMLVLVTCAGCAGCAAHEITPRSAVVRDVTGYAIASCLASLEEPTLKTQGEGWAAMVVQRGEGEIESLGRVSDAVKAACAAHHVYVVHDESSKTGDNTLPLAWCAEIIDQPAVRDALQRAVDEQAPAYLAAEQENRAR